MIDGVDTRIEIQTVTHSHQLAVKKRETDFQPKPRERERDDRKIERLFQIAAGLSVCTEGVFQVKVNCSFAFRTTCVLYSSEGDGKDTESHAGQPSIKIQFRLVVP